MLVNGLQSALMPGGREASKSGGTLPNPVLSQSWRGAAWVLASSAGALTFGFGTNVLLGRTGPDALGFYGLLGVTLSVITTFFVLGGNHVVITYLPKVEPSLRNRFLGTYAVVVIGAAALLLVACLVEPRLLRALYGPSLRLPVVAYLAVLLPVGVAQTLVWSTMQARLQLRGLAVSQQAVPILTCSVVVAVIALGELTERPSLLASRPFLLFTVLAANAVSLVVGAGVLIRTRPQPTAATGMRRRYLPEGFWRFTLSFHLATVLFFLIRNGDQIMVLRELGLTELGYYRSAFVVSQLIAWFPTAMDWTIYPALCNLEEQDQAAAYERFASLNALGTSVIGVVILLFSPEILAMFGRSVSSDSRAVLLLLGGSMVVSAPFVNLNHSVILSRKRVAPVLAGNAASAVVAVIAYTVLGSRHGLVGVGVAFALLQLTMLLISMWMTSCWTNLWLPGRAFRLSLAALVYGVAGALAWSRPGTATLVVRAAMAVAFLPALMLTRVAARKEVVELLRLLVTRRPPRPA